MIISVRASRWRSEGGGGGSNMAVKLYFSAFINKHSKPEDSGFVWK
jgi:hypothetical protein